MNYERRVVIVAHGEWWRARRCVYGKKQRGVQQTGVASWPPTERYRLRLTPNAHNPPWRKPRVAPRRPRIGPNARAANDGQTPMFWAASKQQWPQENKQLLPPNHQPIHICPNPNSHPRLEQCIPPWHCFAQLVWLLTVATCFPVSQARQ